MKKKAIIVSGYFNPIHKGHLEYFHNAKAISEELFVIVNSDLQRELKGSKEFQDEEDFPVKSVFDEAVKEIKENVVPIENSPSGKFYSPLVKTIAKKENISMGELEAMVGTGKDQRVTKNDILA